MICDLCGHRLYGKTRRVNDVYSYYACEPVPAHHMDWFATHPKSLWVREDKLLRLVRAFFADRVFGPNRDALLISSQADDGAVEDATAARVAVLQNKIKDLGCSECPRWESNPHWRRFELRASADWATGTFGPPSLPITLRTATPREECRGPTALGVGQVAETQAGGQRRRVLIAEDEALIRLDLAEMLVEEGYEVVGEAGDGETAVRLAEELKPDLVILDIKMPIMDGLAAAEKIAGARIAPVVILTAFSQRDLVERARAAGAMAYLVKPFQKSDLVPAIEMALSRFAEIAALEAEVAELTDRLETRKAVERAKGALMNAYGMTEPQAFKWIQRTAMDHRMTMREVADRIIAESASGGLTPPGGRS
jgi:two-component system, response regulator PdtaR